MINNEFRNHWPALSFDSSVKPIGCIGRVARDFTFPHASFQAHSHWASIGFRDITITARAERPIRSGDKVAASIPGELWRHAADIRLGGGAFNFVRAVQTIWPFKLRYVDACLPDAMLGRELAYMRAEPYFLGLRTIPRNAIFGHRMDKVILKSPITPAQFLSAGQLASIEELSDCRMVVAHSIVDIPVMERVADICARGSLPLCSVVTTSLPADFVRKVVFPGSFAIFCSRDEVGHVTGFEVGHGMVDAAEAVDWLSSRAPGSIVFLTLGEDGVLCSGPGVSEVLHVRLRPAMLDQIRKIVAANACQVCGCGDAFSAGAALALLSRGAPLGRDTLVAAAAFGCAAAVRWLGFVGRVTPADFLVTRAPAARVRSA